MNKPLVERASSALHDLYGLVPADQRKWADDYVRIVEQALYGYGQAIDFQRAIAANVEHAQRAQGLVEQRIAEIENA